MQKAYTLASLYNAALKEILSRKKRKIGFCGKNTPAALTEWFDGKWVRQYISLHDKSPVVPSLLSLCARFLKNALRQGFIHRLGRKQTSFPFTKRAVDSVKITTGLFLCFQSLERFLKNFCLTKFTPIFVKMDF